MKLRNLFLASVACAGLFAACSNGIDEVIDNGNNETNNGEKAYASFAYALPAGSSTTRANDPGTEVGTDEENKVDQIAFVFFKGDKTVEDGEFLKVVTLKRSEFTPQGTGASTVYQTVSPILVAAETQKVYVIVNPSEAIKTFKDKTEANFKALVEKNFKSGEFFTMSNAETVEKYTFTPEKNNTSSNPIKVTVHVERMAARIDYTAKNADNKYDVLGAEGDKVQIQKYRIVNTRTDAFLLKRVGEVIGAPEIEGSYVMDPIFNNKTNFESEEYINGYSNKLSDKAACNKAFTTKAGQTEVLSYCNENTMPVAAQKTGTATGLIMEAKYTPNFDKNLEVNDKGDFYRYNGKLYPTLKEMYKALNSKWDGASKENIVEDVLGFKEVDETNFDTFAGNFDFETLGKKYVDLYTGGICYYTTFMRHISNNRPQEMGIMEYAIVRNNIYKLSINSVNKLGTPVPPTDPGTDIEESDTYLNVEVKVLNWITRDNAVDL